MHVSQDKQLQRQKLLHTAATLLQSEGPMSLSLRRVAQEANTSTQMIYTLFGGKDGLMMALYESSFEQLAERLNAVAYKSEPTAYLRELAWAIRSFAHEQPMFYEVMFGRALPQFTPPMADHMRQSSAYQLMLQTLQADAQLAQRACIHTMADALWLAIHGALCMELAGFFMDEDQATARYGAMIDALLEGFDKQERKDSSNTPAKDLGLFSF